MPPRTLDGVADRSEGGHGLQQMEEVHEAPPTRRDLNPPTSSLRWRLLQLVQDLVLPRIPEGTDQGAVAPHGVATDGHPAGVGGEVCVDDLGELEDTHRSARGQQAVV